MVNERILSLVGVCIVVFVLVGAFLVSSFFSFNVVQDELDFNVSGSNDCLRFLSRTVKTVYVPLAAGVNEQWELSIECTDIATPNGWVDLYIYDGYWDDGVDNKCFAEDIYPILDEVLSLDFELSVDKPYSQTFGGSTSEFLTVFFIFPPGGPSTFHITITQLN